MPVYATGLSEHETPFTFGTAVPPLTFTWSINNKDVVSLQNVFHKVSTVKLYTGKISPSYLRANLKLGELNYI